MQIILSIISAVIGLQGSTIDPLKDSARLTGLYIALASGLVAATKHFLPTLDISQEQAVALVTTIGYVLGACWYAFGAVRAIISPVKDKVAGILSKA